MNKNFCAFWVLAPLFYGPNMQYNLNFAQYTFYKNEISYIQSVPKKMLPCCFWDTLYYNLSLCNSVSFIQQRLRVMCSATLFWVCHHLNLICGCWMAVLCLVFVSSNNLRIWGWLNIERKRICNNSIIANLINLQNSILTSVVNG